PRARRRRARRPRSAAPARGGGPRLYTDIYGLGVILYELLSGRPPFAAATARETLDQVSSQEPVPPSRFNLEVPPHLEGFCLRCLRKNPWRRYPRAYDLVVHLRYFRENPEVRDVASGRWPRRRPPRREDDPLG